MGKILIVNTGSAEYEYAGWNPVLDNEGQAEPMDTWASAAAGKLQEYQLAAVYFIPVPGAEKMAAVIAGKYQLKPQILSGFAESNDFTWKGLNHEDAVALDCGLDNGHIDIDCIKLPFDVDLRQLRSNLASALDEIFSGHKKETIAIVAHRSISVIMILHMLHMDNRHYGQIAQDKGAVSLFEVRMGMPSALYINDTCHLEGLLKLRKGRNI
ncbi:MAG: histidine phosphatase family protein [Dehalococcoidia bacterium]|nr:histidine phosphatase family protein [Dehalococcoidia bacterium]